MLGSVKLADVDALDLVTLNNPGNFSCWAEGASYSDR